MDAPQVTSWWTATGQWGGCLTCAAAALLPIIVAVLVKLLYANNALASGQTTRFRRNAEDKAASPTKAAETPSKAEESKPSQEAVEEAVATAAAPVTNGDAVPSEASIQQPVEAEPSKKESENVVKAEPETKPAVEEPQKQTEESKVEVSEPVIATEEATKVEEPSNEVRTTEEVPPPLPASNPPSPLTAFAESTKADSALTSGQILLLEQPEQLEQECSVAELAKTEDSTVVVEPVTLPSPSEPIPEGTTEQPLLEEPQINETKDSIPDPSPSIDDLPPAPPTPEPVVAAVQEPGTAQEPQEEAPQKTESPEPPAEPRSEEPSAQAEPNTPPPTPAASSELPSEIPSTEEFASSEEIPPPPSVAPADSLPDISTESLPSLPVAEPETLPPMSLPPVESIPDPITNPPELPREEPPTHTHDAIITNPPESPGEEPPTHTQSQDKAEEKEEVVAPLTNGTMNGHDSPATPNEEEVIIEPEAITGPTKQIPSVDTASNENEISPEAGDKPTETAITTAEE